MRDLRAMVYQAVANVDPSLDHVQVDVLRLLPCVASADYSIPPKILSKQISSQITMSVYNIPNGQDDLKHAMRHLAQLYYNINVLHISNIPMKVGGWMCFCPNHTHTENITMAIVLRTGTVNTHSNLVLPSKRISFDQPARASQESTVA